MFFDAFIVANGVLIVVMATLILYDKYTEYKVRTQMRMKGFGKDANKWSRLRELDRKKNRTVQETKEMSDLMQALELK